MYANEEQIQGLDLKSVFKKMLSEVKWDALKGYINSNANLQKFCTQGGFRLDPNKRDRVEKMVAHEMERNGYSEVSCNGIFAAWYPVHVVLNKELEDYFHSDEYTEYRKANSLADDQYVLPQEKFQAFFKVQDLMSWKILLCFSPLKFSDEQVKTILEDKQDDADTLERLAKAESANKDLTRRVEQLTQETERLRAKQAADANEIQTLRKENRQVHQDCEQFQKRAESAFAEMKRSNAQLAQVDQTVKQKEDALKQESDRLLARAKSDVEAAQNEVVVWRTRHEQQCQENHLLEDRAAESDKRCAQAIAQREEIEKKLQASHVLVDNLLNQIDWKQVLALKAAPQVSKNLRSLVQNLNYDADRNLKIDATLPVFWARLSECEKQLILAIAKSSDRELESGSIKDYWAGLESQFTLVNTTLEARLALLNIMHEIFYQTYTEKQLEDNEPIKVPEAEKPAPEKKPAVKKTTAKKSAAKKTTKVASEKVEAKKAPAKKAPAKKKAAKAEKAE